MELLPCELKKVILSILPMPDKRNLIRCNTELNKFNIKWYEDEFLKTIWNTKFLCDNIHPRRITKVEQYTLEMVYYGYGKLIPERYICNKNELLYKYPKKLYFYCARNSYIGIAKILINCNKTYADEITCEAAYGGHLEILKWARENGCRWDSWTCGYAAKNGRVCIRFFKIGYSTEAHYGVI